VRRTYEEARINRDQLMPLIPHSELIAGVSYVANNCVKLREDTVAALRSNALPVFALGSCSSSRAGNISTRINPRSDNLQLDLQSKREAINKYMVNHF
jgi:hypothetical protein